MINGAILILKLFISHIFVEMLLAPLPMVYVFHSLFVLRDYVLMLMLTIETNF